MSDITITLVDTASGQSESIPVPVTTTIAEVLEWCKALFSGLPDDIRLFRDGKALTNRSSSLSDFAIKHGDLLAIQSAAIANRPHSAPAAPAPPAASAGGLDFSNLLAGAAASSSSSSSRGAPASTGGTGLDFSSLLGSAASQNSNNSGKPPAPVYFDGMQLDDAMQYNPHPHAFCSLLLSKDHLQKELNYHNPVLASKLVGKPLDEAVKTWREEMVRGGIQRAMNSTTHFHKERDMQARLDKDPDDKGAKEYFEKKNAKKLIDEQHTEMMNEYPEAMGRVLMLYVSAKINDHEIQAFCDSGAQSTIMSKKVARECNLLHLVDERFEGMAVGVGTSKIIGRIHVVQLQIGSTYFPCTVTVMDDPKPGASEMPFLLGLDMMKRHLCTLDLENHVLKFRLGVGEYMEAPFLHEKDLSEAQGGTKGFDADKANEKLLKLQSKKDKEDGGSDQDVEMK